MSGFSYFFGLNDFFVDGLADNVWESNVISSGFSATAATLTFRDSTGALGNVAISAGDSLTDIASTINKSCIFFSDKHFFSSTQIVKRNVF